MCFDFQDVQETNTAVSRSNAESELISLDAGLRKESSIASVGLWDCVIENVRIRTVPVRSS